MGGSATTEERGRTGGGEGFAMTTTAAAAAIARVPTSIDCAAMSDDELLVTDAQSSSSPSSSAEERPTPRVGTTRASTAFVVPSPGRHSTAPSSLAEIGNRDDAKGGGESSEVEGGVYDGGAIVASSSPNGTASQNRTDVTTSVPGGVITSAREVSCDPRPRDRKDYISSGYVSSSAP